MDNIVGVVMVSNNEDISKKFFGIVVALLYLIFGIIQIIVSFGIRSRVTDTLYIPNDIMGGVILIIISTIFMFGIKELNEGIDEGVAYIYVGILIALVFMAIYSLVIAANSFSAYVLSNEDFISWTPLDDMKPGLYLGILPLIGFLIWLNKFTLNRSKQKQKEVDS